MRLQRYYFTDIEHARQRLRASALAGMYINVKQTLDDGFTDLYTQDDAHADRICEKYKATTKGEILNQRGQ